MNFGKTFFSHGFRKLFKPAVSSLPKFNLCTRALRLQDMYICPYLSEHIKITQLTASQNILALRNLTRLLEKTEKLEGKD
jgi:hypothetical protein